jgi:hypothetical protein
LASKFTKGWQTVRGQKPLNEQRVAAYERLMDAEEQIAQARSERGVSPATIDEALAASEPADSEMGPDEEPEEDLYLAMLARFVAALGGHLEVNAVFPEETITLRREPDGQTMSEPG